MFTGYDTYNKLTFIFQVPETKISIVICNCKYYCPSNVTPTFELFTFWALSLCSIHSTTEIKLSTTPETILLFVCVKKVIFLNFGCMFNFPCVWFYNSE